MVTQVTDYKKRMEEVAKRIQVLIEEARKQKDIIRINCLTDKLVQVKANQNIADRSAQAMQDSSARNDRDAAFHEYTRITIVNQNVQVLGGEAEACVGEDLSYVGATRVDVDTEGVPPGDPTQPGSAAPARRSRAPRARARSSRPRHPQLLERRGGTVLLSSWPNEIDEGVHENFSHGPGVRRPALYRSGFGGAGAGAVCSPPSLTPIGRPEARGGGRHSRGRGHVPSRRRRRLRRATTPTSSTTTTRRKVDSATLRVTPSLELTNANRDGTAPAAVILARRQPALPGVPQGRPGGARAARLQPDLQRIARLQRRAAAFRCAAVRSVHAPGRAALHPGRREPIIRDTNQARRCRSASRRAAAGSRRCSATPTRWTCSRPRVSNTPTAWDTTSCSTVRGAGCPRPRCSCRRAVGYIPVPQRPGRCGAARRTPSRTGSLAGLARPGDAQGDDDRWRPATPTPSTTSMPGVSTANPIGLQQPGGAASA